MFGSKVKLYDYLQLFGKQFKISCQIKMNGLFFLLTLICLTSNRPCKSLSGQGDEDESL